jgi:diguanylate cyclase (GGDEF)-like protein
VSAVRKWTRLAFEYPSLPVASGLTFAAIAFFAFRPLRLQIPVFRATVPMLAFLIAQGEWRVAQDPRITRASKRFWLIMSWGMFICTAGMVLDIAAVAAGGHLPGLSLTEPGSTLLYPFAGVVWLVALGVFPTAIRGGTERLKITLDVAVVLLGSATFLWYGVVSRRWMPSFGWLALSTELILPALTLVAGFVILRIAMAGANVICRTAMVCFVFAASMAVIPIVLGMHAGTDYGRLGTTIPVLGLTASVFGVVAQRVAGPGRPAAPRTGWRRPFSVLPYSAVIATLALLGVTTASLGWRDRVVVAGVLALCTVVMGRQLTSLSENSRLLSANLELSARLAHQAYHDHLTGLANRALFTERVADALARARVDGGAVAVLFVDLDDFKIINDSLGHQAGDEVLVAVTDRIRTTLRDADVLGRIGGDEFAVLVENHDAESIARRLIGSLDDAFVLSGKQIQVKASVGIATAPGGQPDTDELLRNADVAMYAAKNAHKGCWRSFEPAMLTALLERHQMQAALVEAVEQDEFTVYYQPIVDLVDGAVHGAEALARWRRADGSFVPPERFIPLAEDTGLIGEIDRRVFRQACAQAARWQAGLPAGTPFALHVNVSARQLHRRDLVDDIGKTLADTGLPADRVTLEITETGLGQDADTGIEQLRSLSRLGVHLAIDDFGTGYSSLAYLRRMPVDVLKIDKTFTDELADATENTPLAQVVVALATALHMRTVAEGIEDPGQADRLLALGCRYGQGFHYSRPLPAEEMAELLAAPQRVG